MTIYIYAVNRLISAVLMESQDYRSKLYIEKKQYLD